MLPASNEISYQQAKPTEATNNKATMIMDYTHTYPNNILLYYVSDMQLYIDSDAAYPFY